MRRLSILVLGAMLLAPTPTEVRAQEDDVPPEAALFLILPVGAKGVGVARAMTALEGAESVWWNPAGVAGSDESRFMLTRSEDAISGDGTSVTGLFRWTGFGTVGASYLLLDLGDVQLTDTQGNILGRVSFRYHTGILTGATRLRDDLRIGMNLKLIQSRLSCRGECLDAGVSATTYAVDAGAQWDGVGGLPLTLGAAVVHLGPRLQVVNEAQADPLPARMRAALAYDLMPHFTEIPDVHARVALELETRWRNPQSPAVYVGTEFAAGTDPGIALRAGYVYGADLQVNGAGVGIGVRLERFDLGISKSLASTSLGDSDPVNVTFGYIF